MRRLLLTVIALGVAVMLAAPSGAVAVPSAVLYCTVTICALAKESVTVNAATAVPLTGSVTLVSLMLIVANASALPKTT